MGEKAAVAKTKEAIKQSIKCMKFLDAELERMHLLLISEIDYNIDKVSIENDVKEIRDFLLATAKQIAAFISVN